MANRAWLLQCAQQRMHRAHIATVLLPSNSQETLLVCAPRASANIAILRSRFSRRISPSAATPKENTATNPKPTRTQPTEQQLREQQLREQQLRDQQMQQANAMDPMSEEMMGGMGLPTGPAWQ